MRSAIWAHFQRIVSDKGVTAAGICNICQKRILTCGSSTSGMRSHLRTKHNKDERSIGKANKTLSRVTRHKSSANLQKHLKQNYQDVSKSLEWKHKSNVHILATGESLSELIEYAETQCNMRIRLPSINLNLTQEESADDSFSINRIPVLEDNPLMIKDENSPTPDSSETDSRSNSSGSAGVRSPYNSQPPSITRYNTRLQCRMKLKLEFTEEE